MAGFDWVLRLNAIVALAIAAFNTIPSCYTLGEVTSTENFPPSSFVDVPANATWFGFGVYSVYAPPNDNLVIVQAPSATQVCRGLMPGIFAQNSNEYIYPVNAAYTCPYANTTPFRAFIVVWAVYFGLFAVFRLIVSHRFSPRDFRFYVAVDNYNASPLNRIMCFIGVSLTGISFAVSLYYLSRNNNGAGITITSVQPGIIFVLVNLATLVGLGQREFVATRISSVRSEFPNAILFHTLPGGNGFFNVLVLLLNRSKMWQEVEDAVDYAGHTGNDSKIAALTNDVAALKAAFTKLKYDINVNRGPNHGLNRVWGSRRISPAEFVEPPAKQDGVSRFDA